MPVPSFVTNLFGWRRGSPNCADKDSQTSVAIATAVMEQLGINSTATGPAQPGNILEYGVQEFLDVELPLLAPEREWQVLRGLIVSEFLQYDHLARLQRIILEDETKTLAAEIGRDYLVKPDVTVGLETPAGVLLHASVSCKWTIRSDRVQNIRHEAVILTRHRRGRQPHIVAVTAEPLPSRIAAIARGTGEVDTVYHVALDALVTATRAAGTEEQCDVLDELVGQDRLRDLQRLPIVLVDR